jgi:23S rRNA pseudouridine2605 synthase
MKKKTKFHSKTRREKGTSEISKALFPMRLNKFVAHCGVASRRKAADIIKNGMITVNGDKEINPAVLINEDDQVFFKGNRIQPQVDYVYLLMNKPKNIITTTSDELGRRTVLDLLRESYKRIFPVGRLDRNTTGLLLITNDGDLTQKLAHPSFLIKKVYEVELDQPLTDDHMHAIGTGLELKDGLAEVDGIKFPDGNNRHLVEISLHIGKNRIVRRIFEHLGYRVKKLDRTFYAGLTKKDLKRGWYRHLTEKEVIRLKHFSLL